LWGKTRNQKRRWWCKKCQRSFVWEKKRSGRRIWFRDWLAGLTIEHISQQHRISISSVKRTISQLISNSPAIATKPNQCAHLLVDGTYFKRESCLILYFDNDLKYFQLYRYSKREIKDEIIKDLRLLRRNGINIVSITADGKNALKSSLKKIFPNAKFQRCLVHIQRYAETYITQKPKTLAGVELKEIISYLNRVDSQMARMTFVGKINDWKRRHNDFLKEKTFKEDGGWWYTHRNLRRVIYHIEHALPDMFYYLEDLNIPKDTNGLEGRFTDVKQKFRAHKGLRKSNRENYLAWFIHFKNLKKKI